MERMPTPPRRRVRIMQAWKAPSDPPMLDLIVVAGRMRDDETPRPSIRPQNDTTTSHMYPFYRQAPDPDRLRPRLGVLSTHRLFAVAVVVLNNPAGAGGVTLSMV